MQARLFLLLILLLVTTSFFWEDEEKQLKTLHQSGEIALQKKDYEAAKKAFTDLYERISITPSHKYQVDWKTYVDVALHLAFVYDELNQKKDADELLSQLLAKHPPEDLTQPIKLMKARLLATKQSPCDAYVEMKRLATITPTENWPIKDLSFFHALQQSLDLYYDDLLRKAKLHLLAGCYTEAILLYEDILSAIEKGGYPKIQDPDSLITKTVRYRLAECYYLAANYEKSLRLCHASAQTNSKEGSKLDHELLYLSALCHKEQKEYEKSIALFEHYIHLAPEDELQHYQHALYEIGHHLHKSGNKNEARTYLEKLKNGTTKPCLLASLLLARLDLEDKKPQQAEERLAKLALQLKEDDPLIYECAYLRGRAAYDLGLFSAARDHLIQAQYKKGKWTNLTLYHLAWCDIQMGQEYYGQAEELFHFLLETPLKEEAYLSLAQLYLLSFEAFRIQEPLEKLENLLNQYPENFSQDGKLEAYLLLAEGVQSYEEKEKIYALAAADKYSSSPLYANVWLNRGLNHFQQGLKESAHPIAYFEAAAAAFEKAFHMTVSHDLDLAQRILKFEAKATLCRRNPQATLVLLDRLIVDFQETHEAKEETLFLRGLVAAQLKEPTSFTVAETAFNEIISTFPQGKYREDALYSLAILYYRNEKFVEAEKIFATLAHEFPQSTRTPEAWFWAGESAMYAGNNPIQYRKHVYEDFPQFEMAAEAYFRQYSYSRYLEGGSDVFQHLQGFSSRFPDSPLSIVVNYLLVLHAPTLEIAVQYHEAGMKAFTHYKSTHPQLSFTSIYFHFQTLLQLASRYYDESREEYLIQCEEILTKCVTSFEEPGHPLTSILKHKSPYQGQYEEAEFKLALCYLKRGKEMEAQQMFGQMMKHYSNAGIREGYFLAQVWLQQGKLAMRAKDFDTALNCFDIGISACGSVINENHLAFWLLQSDCYREKKQYGNAMRLLSKVINSETASPLRIKAMYLRSEIYALEERPELAIRQLEATAKKGGEWAKLAQDTLKGKYGI